MEVELSKYRIIQEITAYFFVLNNEIIIRTWYMNSFWTFCWFNRKVLYFFFDGLQPNLKKVLIFHFVLLITTQGFDCR